LKDDNKKDEDEDDAFAKKPTAVDLEKIAETIIGLKTMESKIDDEKLAKYVDQTELYPDPSIGIWRLFCGIALLLLNMMGKGLKNEIPQEYMMRKVVETFVFMKAPEERFQFNNTTDYIKHDDLLRTKMERVNIYNKQLLYEYLIDDFSTIFFTEGYLAQEVLKTVGPVRLRTVHTKEFEDETPAKRNCLPIKKCFHR